MVAVRAGEVGAVETAALVAQVNKVAALEPEYLTAPTAPELADKAAPVVAAAQAGMAEGAATAGSSCFNCRKALR